MKWTKTVPTKPGIYLHQDPNGCMQEDRKVRCSKFGEYDMRVHPNFPPKGWWYMGPITEPPSTGGEPAQSAEQGDK